MKCKWCGTEYEPHDNRIFCHPDCRYKYNIQKKNIESKMRTIAKRNNFTITDNQLKIVKAKLMLFRGGDYMRCPCDAQDPERYCGSPKCTQEVLEKGICHCHLFEKIEDNIDKYK